MKEREAGRGGREGGWNKRGKKIQISNSLSHRRGAEREGRESATFFAAALPNGLGGRAGCDRVKTIQSQRGIGSDKEGRRGTEGSEGGRGTNK